MLVTNLFITKTLKIFDTSKETSAILALDTSYKFINIYYGIGNNVPVKIIQIVINNFNINSIESFKLIGENDKILITCERISSSNIKVAFSGKVVEVSDSFRYFKIELSNV